jgi:N-acetylmuramoyl-L-alanine amidase
MARAIHSGILTWFESHPPAGTLLAWQKGTQSDGRVYVIARGDTLSEIAVRHQVTLDSLKAKNGLSGSTIRIGQVLQIPDGS